MAERIRILVTGGAGYIGSHACKALARAGHLPITFDNLDRGHAEFVRWGPLEIGDLTDRARLDEVMATHRPRAVMHFAALAYVGESVTDPGLYYRNNLVGSLNLIDAARAGGGLPLVFSSTCATYGPPRAMPMAESHPQAPINPYGASKLMVEQILKDYRRAYGLRSISLRYFNAAGADPEGEIGERHDPETHLIPLILDVALGRREALTIHGTDYETPDGTCIRDYIHVADLAEAHGLALDRLLEGGEGGAFNLGTGEGHSVLRVIDTARRITGHAIPTRPGPRRDGDPPRLIADPALARRELGWTPSRPLLEAQIGDAWAWHRKGP